MGQDSVLPAIDTSGEIEDKLIHLRRWPRMLEGEPTVALCGKTYRPVVLVHDDKRPPCSTCIEVMDKLDILYGRPSL